MTMDHRYHHLDTFRSVLSLIIEPIRQVVDLPFSIAGSVNENLSSRSTLLSDNEELRVKNLLLQAKLQKYSSLQSENMRLRELLDSSFKVGDKVLIAELIRVDLDPFTRRIVINKGSNDDLFAGQPLLDSEGIIGQVLQVSPFSSTAMLITDPSHAIPIQLNSTGQRAIATGTGRPGELELLHIPSNTKLEKGELLVSSGLGGRFPAGYPVARVIRTLKHPGKPYLEVIAEPTAYLQRSREVLVVWPSAGPLPEANAGKQ